MDAIREVGPGGHFLGCAHTQANFKTAFWRTQVLDYRPFETWAEAGEPDSMRLANARVHRMLGEYEAPAIDPGVAEALREYRGAAEGVGAGRLRVISRGSGSRRRPGSAILALTHQAAHDIVRQSPTFTADIYYLPI